MDRKLPGGSGDSKKSRFVYDGKNDRLVEMTQEQYRAMPVTHLEPDYQYAYSTYETYDGSSDTFISHQAGGRAAANESNRDSTTGSTTLRLNAASRRNSNEGQSSTSKSKSKDKGKSVAK